MRYMTKSKNKKCFIKKGLQIEKIIKIDSYEKFIILMKIYCFDFLFILVIITNIYFISDFLTSLFKKGFSSNKFSSLIVLLTLTFKLYVYRLLFKCLGYNFLKQID